MKTEREPRLSPRMQQAIEELKGLVREHYPDATFQVARSPEDPHIIHLWTTVDVPDTTQVVDTVLERVLELQIEQKLPIHVIPVQPRDRALEIMRQQDEARKKRVHHPNHEHGEQRYGT